MSPQSKPPKARKRTRKTNPQFAQVMAHIPHPINDRLNDECRAANESKAVYIGTLLQRMEDTILLSPDLLRVVDRFASQNSLTRTEAVRLLLQRSLRELMAF